MDQTIEVCAVKLYHPSGNICILTVYRAPSGNFIHFLNILEAIFNRIHMRIKNIILYGDINVNYLDDMANNKIRLASLLASYHLTSIVDFPTRVSNTSATLIDNIFINRNTNKTFSITPLPNGLSDHDAQLLTLSRAPFLNFSSSSVTRRLINDNTIIEFKNNLSTEYWADIFNINDDINTMFNNFINTYLRIFNNSFPCKKFILSHRNQPWLTTGIKVSRFRKRE
jgi:hypothetical protein